MSGEAARQPRRRLRGRAVRPGGASAALRGAPAEAEARGIRPTDRPAPRGRAIGSRGGPRFPEAPG